MKKSLGRLISILYRKSHLYKNYFLSEYNITASEQPFITTLYFNDGVSQEFLSSYLSIDKASTTRVVQSLIEKGYIEKVRDENDKRVNRIYLTKDGRATEKGVMKVLKNWSEILTDDMNEEEKEIAYSLLTRMVDNLEKSKLEFYKSKNQNNSFNK